MKVQSIISYSNYNYSKVKSNIKNTPQKEVNFKGAKGFITGGAIGSLLTAGGVALIAGTAAVPAFLGYVVVNGTIGALSGHLAQDDNKKE